MTQEEAREVLLRFRSLEMDGVDPEVQRALELTKRDPELRRWFEGQRHFNEQARNALREIEPPEGLREQILGEAKITRPVWRRIEFLAAAACIALLLGGLLFWGNRPQAVDTTYAAFREQMLSFALRRYTMDIFTNSQPAVRAYLATNGIPSDFALPKKLEAAPVLGGGALSWENQPVGMMCFAGPTNQTLFLFVTDAKSMRRAPAEAELRFNNFRRLKTAEWREKDRVFVLGGEIDPQSLKRLVDQ
jgi:hypothetical protein